MARQPEIRSAILDAIQNHPQGISVNDLVKLDITGRTYLTRDILPKLVAAAKIFEIEEGGLVKYLPREGAAPTKKTKRRNGVPAAEEVPEGATFPAAEEMSVDEFKRFVRGSPLTMEQMLGLAYKLIMRELWGHR